MRYVLFAIFSCLLALAATVRGETVPIEKINFDRQTTVHDQAFTLHGVGLLRYRVIFRAYVGALYLGDSSTIDALWNENTPVRLELEYFWAIKGSDFGPAAVPFLKDNMTESEFQAIRERADQLSALYQDVEPGDRYALTFIPGRGTELALNGKPLGLIKGDDFARLYFRVWLGERPIDTRFRDQLFTNR